ncbi:MAG: hypothetical protein GY835_23815 [bacterium]|nr:hypothetical protein [bacterium]
MEDEYRVILAETILDWLEDAALIDLFPGSWGIDETKDAISGDVFLKFKAKIKAMEG